LRASLPVVQNSYTRNAPGIEINDSWPIRLGENLLNRHIDIF
jgi:hypothetical protein